MSSENREDYLINILRLTDGDKNVKTSKLAAFMNVAPASVTEMLRVLADSGYVNYVKYQGVSLTPEGLAYARNIRRKHHVIERFLTDVLGIDHENAHNQACLMEHSVSDDSINRICRMIGTKIDHDCSTCDNPCGGITIIGTTALQMSVGDEATISHIQGTNGSDVRKLVSMGFAPGRSVRLAGIENGTRIFECGELTVVVEDRLASIVVIDME